MGTGSKFGIRITYSHEPVILGTGGGIKQAEPHFSGEPVLILNGDTLVELDLEALRDFHCARNAAATLVLREDADAARWGLVEVGDQVEEGQVLGLIEAMKVFSEVPSEIAGTVIEFAVQNADMVQHGDVLLYVVPD